MLTPSLGYKEPKTCLAKIFPSIGFGNYNTTNDIELTDEIKEALSSAGQ